MQDCEGEHGEGEEELQKTEQMKGDVHDEDGGYRSYPKRCCKHQMMMKKLHLAWQAMEQPELQEWEDEHEEGRVELQNMEERKDGVHVEYGGRSS